MLLGYVFFFIHITNIQLQLGRPNFFEGKSKKKYIERDLLYLCIYIVTAFVHRIGNFIYLNVTINKREVKYIINGHVKRILYDI